MENQGVKASALPYLYLGLQAPQDVSKAATLAEEHKKEAEGGAVSDPVSIVENAEISAEDFARIKEVSNDLLWLISEGYVVEYADGALQANPRLPRPKDKGAKTIASDAESIVLGVEDEPIVSPKVAEETEECDAHEETSDTSEEESQAEQPQD